jgi:hypothetical protein
MKTELKFSGKLNIELLEDGKVVQRIKKHNLIVNVGLQQINDFIAGQIPATAPVSHLAIGDGQTAATPTDTTLENELHRTTATITQVNLNDVQFQARWTPGTASGTYYEAGLFDADADGNMFSRSTFPELIVEDIHQIIITWTISIAVTTYQNARVV